MTHDSLYVLKMTEMLEMLRNSCDRILTYLDFLEAEDEPGFRSRGHLPGVNSSESTVFCISTNSADDLEVQNDGLVPFSIALATAKEFFASGQRPQCVNWLEL